MADTQIRYGNYVKFLRGTPTAYFNLSPKDKDTLYFISERNATQGVLYLGDKLISGSLTTTTSLNDLQDILISNDIQPGSLLYYDGENWVDKPLDEILEIIVGVMVGATATTNGKSGLVPVPIKGMQNLYLRGNGEWDNPLKFIQPTVDLVVEQVGTLIGNDTDMSVREIAQAEVQKIVDGAPEAFDTLKEIATYLVDHPTDANLAERLVALENALNDENIGLLHRVDAIELDIDSINNALEELRAADQEHDAQITNIQNILNALRWQDMEDE